MPPLTSDHMQAVIEAALLIADQPLSLSDLSQLFAPHERPETREIRSLLTTLQEQYQQKNRGIQLQEVATGYRMQAKAELSPWLSKLWENRTPRYSRAFLETLIIIAYKQPVTRAEIEDIRGVTVSSQIMKTLQEREWIRILGYRDLPGKPAIYGTTKTFLDYFNLKNLTDLPTLPEFKNLTQEEHIQLQESLTFLNQDETQINEPVLTAS